MKRWTSSKHDSRDLIERLESSTHVKLEVPHSSQIENIEPVEGVRFVVVGGKYTLVSQDSEPLLLLPFIGSTELVALFPSVRVDEGAVKPILNGADVMRPGVVSYDEWGEVGRMVAIREAKKDRGIAIGRALVASSDMASMQKGGCVKNLHHLGDRYWNLHKQV